MSELFTLTDYHVWCPNDGQERADAKEVKALSHGDAAELYVESFFSRLDYPEVCTVCVQPVDCPADHDRMTFEVVAEMRPEFRAMKI